LQKKASNPSSSDVSAGDQFLGIVETEGTDGIWFCTLFELDMRRFKVARNFGETSLLRMDPARLRLAPESLAGDWGIEGGPEEKHSGSIINSPDFQERSIGELLSGKP
jgi:hypothetical protein